MSVVLVTGASGFIGRHAVMALLDAGFTVHALAREPVERVPATWHRADLVGSDDWLPLVEKLRPSHLLHLAWETRHGYFWQAPENLDWLAVTLKLVRAFHSHGGWRIVAAGSCAEYDWSPAVLDAGPCNELTTPLAPTTLYGTAKLAAYHTLSAFAQQTALSLAWARLFLLYGPGETSTRLVPYLIQSLDAGRPVRLGSGDRIRDFMDARDAGAALAAVLASDVSGAVNVASGEPVSFRQLARLLTGLMKVDPQLVSLDAPGPPGADPRVLTADTLRLTTEVGYRPRVSLKSGLHAAVAWWRAQAPRACGESRGA